MRNLIFFLFVFGLLSCKNGAKPEYTSVETMANKKKVATAQSHPGKEIMETECYICHDPMASQESMIAPPFIAIKKYYIDENSTKDQFTEDLIKWVNDPETESKMPDALFEFGSMPYIPYPDDAIAQIAEYLYDYDIERPNWYDAALKKGKGNLFNRDMVSKEIQENNSKKGMAYAKAAQTALGKNLIKAIGEKGTIGAIEFCNTRALALTDSISVMNNAVIKRVSDNPRNPKNMADEEELGYITYFKKLVASGKDPKPIVKIEKNEVDFYYPITTNAMCLQCHGQPNDQVTGETLARLKNLYPADEAIGYEANEVRGIWGINFEKKQ